MAWLAGLLEPMLEKFLVWIFGIFQKDYKAWKEKHDDTKKAEDNSALVDQAKTDDERRRDVTDLLNGN